MTNDRSRRALDNLCRVLEILEVYGIEEHVTFDLGELRGLDYHTGIIFQGYLPGLGRAVCSGGRYDGLTARYGYPAPATGFAFNVLNLLFALDRELEKVTGQSNDVLIFQSGKDKEPAQRLARVLRARGYSVARDIIPRDLDASIVYARKMNFRYMLVSGEREEEIRLLRLTDRAERRLPYQAVLAPDFIL